MLTLPFKNPGKKIELVLWLKFSSVKIFEIE